MARRLLRDTTHETGVWHAPFMAPARDDSEAGGPVISREQVENVLGRMRPFLQADGGDIELVEVTGNRASVRLTGHCVGCPSAHMTLYLGIETAIKQLVPEFEELLVV